MEPKVLDTPDRPLACLLEFRVRAQHSLSLLTAGSRCA